MSAGEGIEARINGERRSLAAGSTVAELVRSLGLEPGAVAVEHNGEILSRDRYATTTICSGDRLEVVRFVQGGASSTS